MLEILSMNGIVKTFPGVRALNGVHFELRAGEVHALVGENGAGKSTLMNILTGMYQADEGEIVYNGERISVSNPRKAQKIGINIVHQEIHLLPDLSIAENIFVGFEPRKRFFKPAFDFKKMNSTAKQVLAEIGLAISPETIVGKLSVAQQQMVAIARVLALDSKIVVLDEPTAALSATEVDALYTIVEKLKMKGIGIIYISHRIEELDVVADRVTVFRDGNSIATFDYKETSKDELISLMVGRELTNQYPKHHAAKGREILRVNRLTTQAGLEVSDFVLYQGEILGIYGLVGAGRTEFARALFGADGSEKYDVLLNGRKLKIRSTVDAVKNGLGYLTEDRKKEGLALGLTVENNITLANLRGFSKCGIMEKFQCAENSNNYVKSLKIRAPSIHQITQFLSGGNQQKVIIARWLSSNSKVLIFDEPTRGIDVGARKEIYDLLNRLVEDGIGVIVISSDLPEVLGVSDRIMVMHDFRFTGELNRNDATSEKLMAYAVK